ncbi:MAG: NAD(P)/FAD-dependent oxidoreductase [Flavobacteriaceae bacterium]|nr:NAD(P)/FAD-dependent oxidoreductase [Flavobacteriaceae bacterium]
MKKVGIIGAGYAGLATARIFKQYGFETTVYEKDKEVGGVWTSSRRYPGLTTQNPKDTYYLSDLKMPKDYPEWPVGKQVQEYLEMYVDHCDLRKNILVNKEVTATTQNTDGTWCLEAKDVKTGEKTTTNYDYLIVCNGIFSEPFVPPYKGTDEFVANRGRVLHTSQFNNRDEAKDKNILIVGYGKSSCDVASSVSGIAKSTHVIARSIIWKVPKKFYGVLNFKYILLTRLGENLFPYIRRSGMPKFLHTKIGKPIRNGLLGLVQAISSNQLKLKATGLHPGNSLETIARANVSLASDNFFKKVRSKEITVHKGASIQSLQPGKATLSTGEVIDVDIVVCGTGWKQQVPFMQESVMQRVLDENDDFFLFKNQLPIGVTNLAFNGYNSSFYSQLNSEIGALWLAEVFTKGFELPSESERIAYTKKYLAWSKERSNGKNSRGTNIIPFSLNHIDSLLGDIGIDLSRFKKFMQWNVPAEPSDYNKVIKKAIKRFGNNRKSSFHNN